MEWNHLGAVIGMIMVSVTEGNIPVWNIFGSIEKVCFQVVSLFFTLEISLI